MKSTVAAMTALVALAAHAAQPSAEAVARRCADAKGEACTALLDGFLAGYTTGVQKGIRATFTHDALVLQTTDGNEDTYARYRRVADRAVCLPETLDGVSALGVFGAYLKANPDTAQEPFGDVMEVALDAAFPCKPSAGAKW